MSKANPKKAVAALIPSGSAVIRPMTLGMYAALERIGSPLVTGEDAKDTLELLPSLYLLTHDPREVFRGNILDLAMSWADTQPVEAIETIRTAAIRQMQELLDVLPEVSGSPKKKTTAGSPNISTGRRGPTPGASTTSCGTSRPRPSRSSGVRTKCGRTIQGSFRSRQ